MLLGWFAHKRTRLRVRPVGPKRHKPEEAGSQVQYRLLTEKLDAAAVQFPDTDGTILRGVLIAPRVRERRLPVLVMTTGFSLTYKQGLQWLAEAVSEAGGIAVLVYDHRSFGGSDGEPRCAVDQWGQVRGYCAALDFLQRHGGEPVDCDRLAVFGYSLSSSQALLLGAFDERVKCVVAAAPTLSPPENVDAADMKLLRQEFDARAHGSACWPASERRRQPATPAPVVCPCGPWPADALGNQRRPRTWFGGRIPGGADAQAFVRRRGGPSTGWVNSASQVPSGPGADWGAAVPQLRTPTLLIAARDDATIPFSAASELAGALPPDTPCLLHVVEAGGHFGLFDSPMSSCQYSDAPAAGLQNSETGGIKARGTPEQQPPYHPAEVRRAARAIADFVLKHA